jgi:hypothetical protein
MPRLGHTLAVCALGLGLGLVGCLLALPIDTLDDQAAPADTGADATTEVADGAPGDAEAGGPCATPCPAGHCRDGACVIADQLRKPRHGLAVDGTNVYWTTLCGELMKHALAGGFSEALFTRDGASFGALRLTSAGAAWTDRTGREVLVMPLSGTPSIRSIAPEAGLGTPVDLAVGSKSGALFWLGTSEVWSVSFDGGVPGAPIFRARAGGLGDSLIAAEPTLAWTLSARDGLDAGGVRTLSLDAGSVDAALDAADASDAAPAAADAAPDVADVGVPVTRLLDLPRPARALAWDGAALYVAVDDGTIQSLPLGGGTPRIVVSGIAGVEELALDDGFVYWTARGSGADGRVQRAPKLGTAATNPIATYASGLAYPGALVVTSSYVYWVEEGAPDETSCTAPEAAHGAVVRVAK